MKIRFFLLFALSAIGASIIGSCAAAPNPSPTSAPQGAYILDPNHTSVTWSLSHSGLSNYTARFNGITGALDFYPQSPEKSRVDILIDPMSLSTGLPDFDKTLINDKKYFDAENHPEIRFTSTDITPTGETTAVITGDLTFRGVTRSVDLITKFNGAGKSFGHPGETLGFSASAEIYRSKWGMDYLITLANIGDKVTLRIEAEFNEKQ